MAAWCRDPVSHLTLASTFCGGLITSDYRGEIKIIIANSSDKAFALRQGDRVAQLIIEKFDNLDSMRLLSIGASSNSGR